MLVNTNSVNINTLKYLYIQNIQSYNKYNNFMSIKLKHGERFKVSPKYDRFYLYDTVKLQKVTLKTPKLNSTIDERFSFSNNNFLNGKKLVVEIQV